MLYLYERRIVKFPKDDDPGFGLFPPRADFKQRCGRGLIRLWAVPNVKSPALPGTVEGAGAR